MKILLIVPAIAFFGTLSASQAVCLPLLQDKIADAPVPGNLWIAQVEKEFKDDKYSDFLNKLDQYYFKQKDEPQKEIHLPPTMKTPPPMPPELAEKTKLLQAEFKKMEETRDQILLDIAKEAPQLHISKAIQNAIPPLALTQEEQDALNYFIALDWGKEKAPNAEVAALVAKYQQEKNLVFKAFSDPQAATDLGINIPSNPIQKDELGFQLIVLLDLNKFDELQDIEVADPAFKNKLALATKAFPVTAARSRDLNYIVTLGRGSRLPSNPAEEKVLQVIDQSVQKRREILKKYSQ